MSDPLTTPDEPLTESDQFEALFASDQAPLTVLAVAFTGPASMTAGQAAATPLPPVYAEAVLHAVREHRGAPLPKGKGVPVFGFDSAADAAGAAAGIQLAVDRLNLRNAESGPILPAIALYSGMVKGRRRDGSEVVALVAQQCCSLCRGGEILLTGKTRELLHGEQRWQNAVVESVRQEFPKPPFKLYTLVWSRTEAEWKLPSRSKVEERAIGAPRLTRRAVALAVGLILTYYLGAAAYDLGARFLSTDKYTIDESAERPAGQEM